MNKEMVILVDKDDNELGVLPFLYSLFKVTNFKKLPILYLKFVTLNNE